MLAMSEGVNEFSRIEYWSLLLFKSSSNWEWKNSRLTLEAIRDRRAYQIYIQAKFIYLIIIWSGIFR